MYTGSMHCIYSCMQLPLCIIVVIFNKRRKNGNIEIHSAEQEQTDRYDYNNYSWLSSLIISLLYIHIKDMYILMLLYEKKLTGKNLMFATVMIHDNTEILMPPLSLHKKKHPGKIFQLC